MSASINEELAALLRDLKKVQNLSKGMNKNRVSDTEPLIVSSAQLLRHARWALPTVPDNIQVRDEIADDLPSVTIITGQSFSVLHDLLSTVSNAVEVMPDRGEITLRAFNQSPFVQIEVTDTGPEIRSEERDKIFNLFYPTKEPPKFCLWKSRQYPRANAGEFTLASEPGRGATFILTLPMPDRQAVGDSDARSF
jgi:signal transduction histidine kinase